MGRICASRFTDRASELLPTMVTVRRRRGYGLHIVDGIASSCFGADVQNGASITSSTCCPSLTNLINLVYDDASVASYYYGTASGETKLVRRFCDAAGNLVADVTLVHYGGTSPTLTCSS